MTDPTLTSRMYQSLLGLHQALLHAPLPLQGPGSGDEVRDMRDQMIEQIENYILPRLTSVDAPLLAVVGGSTGSGKSTLVNSLVETNATEAGVIRPTTRSPVLVHHPDDTAWFIDTRILPQLPRSYEEAGIGSLRLVSSQALPPGLAILDAPDFDSVDDDNRALSASLLQAADLWLFVTSAARYADQLPWSFLQEAAERSTAVAVILDRTQPDAIDEVSRHLGTLLSSRGLKDSPLFAVPESDLNSEGRLDPQEVSSIKGWLTDLAQDAGARHDVMKQTLDGAIRTIARNTYRVAEAAAVQVSMAHDLRDRADNAYIDEIARINIATTDGTMARGDVLARWHQFVSTGELVASLETKVGRRERTPTWGSTAVSDSVVEAIETGLVALLLEHAERGARAAGRAWAETEAGERLLQDPQWALGRAGGRFIGDAVTEVRAFIGGVTELVRTQVRSRVANEQVLPDEGLTGLSVALMMMIFSTPAHGGAKHGGSLGQSGVLGRRLLESMLGDANIDALAETVRTDLRTRVSSLLVQERGRYTSVLDTLGIQAEGAVRLHQESRRVDDLRFEPQIPEGAY